MKAQAMVVGLLAAMLAAGAGAQDEIEPSRLEDVPTLRNVDPWDCKKAIEYALIGHGAMRHHLDQAIRTVGASEIAGLLNHTAASASVEHNSGMLDRWHVEYRQCMRDTEIRRLLSEVAGR